MTTDQMVVHVLRELNALGAPYMIVGSVAANFYCVPRSTQDADIVIQSGLASFARELSQRLETLRLDPQLGFETVTATSRAILRSTQHDFYIELFELSVDPHDQLRFSRRVKAELLGVEAWISSAEDLIITKLRWAQSGGREKDIADVRNLIAVQGDLLDWPYVESWTDQHGTRAVLDQLRGTN